MKLSHVLLAFAASAVPASAQHVVFQDGFESGLSNWTASGLAHLEDAGSGCGAQFSPFPGGSKAVWYGHYVTACTYSTGSAPNAGGIVLNDWVDLPDAPSIGLHFWMWSETEYCLLGPQPQQYDIHSVTVMVEQPSSTTEVRLCPEHGPAWVLLPWHERRVDLSAFRGLRVRVGIGFDTVDAINNSGRGWLVDDVRIVAEPGERVCPGSSFASGCPCQPRHVPVAGGCRNSTGQSAVLFSSGSVAVAGDTLELRAEHMPPATIGLLIQSSTPSATVTFGDGLSCTGGPTIRLGTLQASNGVATWPPPGTPSISQRGLIPPTGGVRFYSVVYRDVLAWCGPSRFNLTETQRIQWVP